MDLFGRTATTSRARWSNVVSIAKNLSSEADAALAFVRRWGHRLPRGRDEHRRVSNHNTHDIGEWLRVACGSKLI